MLNNREHSRIIILDSIIVLVIVFFGLLMYNNSLRSSTKLNRNPISSFIPVIENSAISNLCVRFQVYQKTWILNKDNFNLLAFNRNTLSENNKTDIRVYHLKIIRQNSHKIPQFMLRYHLFPPEPDEPPYLS
jgi:hypothetical protein